MNNVLCMGELLLRLSPSPKDTVADKHPMLLFVGGAEANVAFDWAISIMNSYNDQFDI